ncbi:hypothetical protein PoB_002981600 [Plakobranchus ocellatus]|uniref:Uncharacterized protein n=1 Tax=Plakobranchus ocellatus TaxID=259542 RepID=A0AAV3ZWH3_9GAST|nr:hypothetical protein PoB_002981600 [Plakobranchus ocellatus]
MSRPRKRFLRKDKTPNGIKRVFAQAKMLKKREEKLFERLVIGQGSQLISYANQRLKGLKFADCLVYRKVTFSPQQGDFRLSGPPSGQGAGDGARTRDRRIPADLRADSLATEPPMPLKPDSDSYVEASLCFKFTTYALLEIG